MEIKTVVFLGSQGSGKGTQASLLKKCLEEINPENPTIELETGQHFRELMGSGSYTGERIKALLDDGQMIPNFFTKHIVLQDLAPRLTQNAHLTLDGFPRNERQVQFLDDLMEFYQRSKLSVVYLDVPEEVVIERLKDRGRFDDTDELITERLRLYHENTQPLIKIYREREDVQFIELDGTKPIAELASSIRAALGV
jgi:adenylate kinase